jgi:O-antigen/teichoic acid export membrane protein
VEDLKEKMIRGGLAKVCSQGANFVVRVGSLMILARLLDPNDFGLVGMVTAVTGVFHLFKEFGLSTATIQRATVTEEQLSTLFWINLFIGVLLGTLSLALAPAIAKFYHEPRLFAVTAVLGIGFVFNAAGVQHSAILQREMRFTSLAVIETVSILGGTAVAFAMATHGYGYWALVATTIIAPFISTICVWFTTGWIPGLPRRQVGIRSMMGFGGKLTLNGLVAYLAYNLEKVLLGRYWGADAVGLYGRAFQLINIPTDNLNSAVGGVVFAALSRVQHDAERFKSFFLKSYSLVLTLTVPITVVCVLFASDVIYVILGSKWGEAVPIFRLLAPTILIFAIINPLGWVLYSLGLVGRGLKIAVVFAPLIIAGYILGLPHGPKGVAFAYSAVMIIWVIPHIAWCVHGTPISLWDVLVTVSRPVAASVAAGLLAFGVRSVYGQYLPSVPRLALESIVLLVTFLSLLFFFGGQKSLYLDLLRGIKKDLPAIPSGA